MQFRDLGAQYAVLKDDMDKAIADTVIAGRFIGGDPVNELEAALAEYVGVKHCITCGNGTDALQLALMAWGMGPGDAVFVPDFTFFSSGEAPAVLGATPVFVDVDEGTSNIDAASLKAAVEYVERETHFRPRAVVAVDLFGQPADYAAIHEVCEEHGLLILEDGAQGFGGHIGDRMACSFGDIGTTSFFPAKPLGCYGDGGAVFTDNDEWAALVRSYAVHGKGTMKYDNVRLGMNSRLDTIQAAILRAKLPVFAEREVDAVNEVAAWYDASLEGCGLGLPRVLGGYTSSWAQYTVRLPEGCDRSAVQTALKVEGIPTNVYYPKPMHEQAAFSEDAYGRKSALCPDGCPTTKALCGRVLSLPMGPYLTRGNAEAVAGALCKAVVCDSGNLERG